MKIYENLKNVICYNRKYVMYKIKEELLIAEYDSDMYIDVFFQSLDIENTCRVCKSLSLEIPVSQF